MGRGRKGFATYLRILLIPFAFVPLLAGWSSPTQTAGSGLAVPVRFPPLPLVCAHRGRVDEREAENSVTVMQRTWAAGIPMVEFDLRRSRDGVVFLLHDETLDRATNGSGPLAAKTATELSQVLLRDGSAKGTAEPLNRFDALLDWARGNDVLLMVDLKDTPPALAADAIRSHGVAPARILLLTFDAKTTRAALDADPHMIVSVLVKNEQEIAAAMAEAQGHPLALYVPQTAEPAVFRAAQKTGLLTITDAMGGVDDVAERQGGSAYRTFLVTHPVEVLVTNHPEALTRAIGQR